MLKKISDRLYRVSTGWVTLAALIVFVLFTALVLPGQSAREGSEAAEAGSPDLSLWYAPADLYGMAEACGEFDKERPEDGTGHPADPVFVPRGLTKRELLEAQRRGYLKFYLSFRRIWRMAVRVRSTEDMKKYLRGIVVLVKLLVGGSGTRRR